MTASVLLYWHLERNYTTLSLGSIDEPKKKYGEVYAFGEYVKAKFQSAIYSAVVIHVSNDRAELKVLEKELEKLLKINKSTGITVEEVLIHMRLVIHTTIAGSTSQPNEAVKKTKKKSNLPESSVLLSTGSTSQPNEAVKKTKKKSNLPESSVFTCLSESEDDESKRPPKKKKKTTGKNAQKKKPSKNKKSKETDESENDLDMVADVMRNKAEKILQRKRDQSPASTSDIDILSDEDLHVPTLSPLASPQRSTLSVFPVTSTPMIRKPTHPSIMSPVGTSAMAMHNTMPMAQNANQSRSVDVDDTCDVGVLKRIEESLSRLERKHKKEKKEMSERLSAVENELKSLKKKFKKFKKRKNEVCDADDVALFEGISMTDLRTSVVNEADGSKMANKLLTTAFNEQYISSHSITGQKANKNSEPRPAMHQQTVTAIKNILHEKLGEPMSVVHGRLQNVQRVIRARERQNKTANKN